MKNWEEEFDERFNSANYDALINYPFLVKHLKDFIRQSLKDERVRVLDKLSAEFSAWIDKSNKPLEYFMCDIIKKLKE